MTCISHATLITNLNPNPNPALLSSALKHLLPFYVLYSTCWPPVGPQNIFENCSVKLIMIAITNWHMAVNAVYSIRASALYNFSTLFWLLNEQPKFTCFVASIMTYV